MVSEDWVYPGGFGGLGGMLACPQQTEVMWSGFVWEVAVCLVSVCVWNATMCVYVQYSVCVEVACCMGLSDWCTEYREVHGGWLCLHRGCGMLD